LEGQVTSSRPAFCWEADVAESSCFVLQLSPEIPSETGEFPWWYEQVSPTAYASSGSESQVSSNRWQVIWGKSAAWAEQGTDRPPSDVAPKVLPPGRYYWRVSAADSCDGEPTATSAAGSFVVKDPWQDLLKDPLQSFQEEGYYLEDLLALDLDGSPVAMAVMGPYVELEEYLGRVPTAAENYSSRRPRLIRQYFSDEPARVAAYTLQGTVAKEIYQSTAPAFVDLDRQLSGQDINADGVPELVAHYGTGGNCWACGWVEIYQVKNGALQRLPMQLPPGTSPGGLQDIDEDGIYEVVAIDFRFELRHWCHACSPGAQPILAWDGQRYVEASARYPSFYEESIAGYQSQLQSALANHDPDGLTAAAVGLLMNYALKGDVNQGWELYKNAVRPENMGSSSVGLFENWDEALSSLNLVLARIYGFRDFGADEYLTLADYPQSLKDKIARAAESGNEQTPYPDNPYDAAHSPVLLAEDGPPQGDHIRINYDRAADVLEINLLLSVSPTDICDYSSLEANVPGLLGVATLDDLPIVWNRMCWATGSLDPPEDCGESWKVEYFNNLNLVGYELERAPLIRCEASPTAGIESDWDRASPGPGVSPDYFSARWTGSASFEAGTYRVSLSADDGFRLWVDDSLVLDEWRGGPLEAEKEIELAAGTHTLKAEYFDIIADAFVNLRWQMVSVPTSTPAPRPTLTPMPTGTPSTICIPAGWSVMGLGTSQWRCVGDVIEAHSSAGDSILASSDDYADVVLSARVGTNNREASLAIRMQDISNGYIVIFIPDGVSFRNGSGGLWIAERVAYSEDYIGYYHGPGFPSVGESALLSVSATGSSIEVSLNGQEVLQASDTTYTSGRIGLRINGDAQFPCDSSFADIAVH
jgi:hypothetical protein